MKLQLHRVDLRIALIYAIFGGLWITLSDRLLAALVTDISLLSAIQTYKGWAFVLLSALVIFLLLRRELRLRRITEGNLGESEKNYHALFNSMDEGYCVIEVIFDEQNTAEDYRFLEVNPGFEKQTGLNDALGKTIRQLAPDTDEHWFEIYGKVARTGESIRFESPALASQRYFDVFAFRIGEEGSRKVGVIFNDITDRKRAEESLRTNAETFSVIFKKAPFAAGLTNIPDGTYLEANEEFERVFGFRREEIIGRTSLDLGMYPDPEQRARSAELFRKQGYVHNLDMRLQTRTGELHDVLVNSDLVEIGGEKFILTTANDITERKQAEEKLHASELRYRTLITQSPIGIYETDANGNCLFVNPRWSQIGGLSLEEALGDGWVSAIYADDRERVSSEWDRTAAMGEPFDMEYRFRTPKGVVTWVHGLASAVRNEQGEISGYFGTISDITERKQAEEKIAYQANLLANVNDAVIASDENFVLTSWNHSAERIYGWAADEVIGKSGTDILQTEFLTISRPEAIKQLVESGEYVAEVINSRKDGTKIYVETRTTALRDPNGKTVGYVSINRDITERKRVEEELAEKQKFLENITETTPDIVYFYDPRQQRHIYFNRELESLLGYSNQEIKKAGADLLLKSIHSQDLPRVMDHIKTLASAQDDSFFEIEYRIKGKDDSYLWFYVREKVYLRNNDGQPELLFGIVQDVSERKHAEQMLRESEEKYRRLTENAADIIFRFELVPEMKLTYINGAVEKITGYTPQECMADPNLMFNMIHSDDLPLMAEDVATRAVPDEPLFMRWMAKNGSMLWMESRIVQTRDESGQLLAVEGITRDMTERKKSEEKIRRQVEYLNALRDIDRAITSTFDMKVSLNLLISKSMRILEVDAAAVLLLNPVTDALEFAAGGGFKTDVIRTSSVKLGESYAGRVAQERRAIQVPNLALEPRNLFPRDFLENENFAGYYGAPLIVKGKVIGVLEIFHRSVVLRDAEWLDIFDTLAGQAAIATDQAQLFESLQRSNVELERRVAERTTELQRLNLELKHANRAKDEFLATMSHELRTPLNSILGLSETLLEQRRDPLSERQQRSLQIVESSGRHLLELINDVLDLSKIEAGKFDYYPQVIEANTLCQSSLSFVRQQAMSKFIELDLAEDPAASKLYADPRRLKQILVNLLTNAVKFTPEHGTVKLQVRSDAERNLIQFSVIDTGIGIAAEDMKKLFQPFSQVDSSLTREFEGTGLGLALVQKLTDLHGGSVEVESEPGKGSRFAVNIPWRRDLIAQQEAIEMGNQPLISEVNVMPPTQMRGKILLAEDNVANVLTIGEYLDSHGFEVVTASDGLQAIELTEETSPELILMDIQMPALDGLEAIRKLRADPRFASTPIIALTALAMPGDRERCLEAGADEYLSKPVSLKMLVETMDRLLGAKKPKSANS